MSALVRKGSDDRFLKSLGVDLVEGDLTEPSACERATRSIDHVFHAAAKVGDWGGWAEFQRGCLDATSNLATSALRNGARRFVHISSTSAYGHPTEGQPPVDETAPLGQNLWAIWDYYTRSKVECEKILWKMAEGGLPLTIIRPSWLYGERDRTTSDRLVRRLRAGGIPTIGPGDNFMSAIYAGNVADLAVFASDHPLALGQAFNLTDQGAITQWDYLNLWASICGAPPIRKRRNYRVVFAASFVLEAIGKLRRSHRPPLITRYATWLMGRRLTYSNEKAKKLLGWSPALGYKDSIERTVRWYDGRKTVVADVTPATAGLPSPNSL